MEITPSLRGSLGELYYKEGCDQKGWAYVSLENIYVNRNTALFKENNVIVFKKGFHRISVKIPDKYIDEIKRLSEPTNKAAERPSFVFDFLACKVGQRHGYDGIVVADKPRQLCWAEIKTGGGDFTDNQMAALDRIGLPLAVFYIEDVLAPPTRIEVEWDIMTGKEWTTDFEEGDEGNEENGDDSDLQSDTYDRDSGYR